ncbi:hypothetical protein H1R17_11355 [Flavobacterium sp. xlx-214]|uniref:hypothetical protein n=1 Tax=unclassified Flavobacterium TaxID=196869 RepID=UPI0013D70987|nr:MULTISPECIES: hypothetical protein [unclassified Flavobacterium]MBA5791812.1 hypothetical protein [Flavobacterium sp. xlx-221]QMI83049.1 hypothetical protein H1R17_11355 [Flavobacterium sp. xlx-214]
MNSYKKKILLLSILISFKTIAQKHKTDILVPYFKNNKWGLVTDSKTVKIPPKYDALIYIHPYYLAQKDSITDILDINGKSIGKNYLYVGEIKKDKSYLFIENASIHAQSNIYGENSINQYDSSFYLYKLENNQFTKLTDATSDALLANIRNGRLITPNFFFVTKNGLSGVYDIVKERYLIEPKYKNFHVPKGNYIIAYNDEKNIVIKHQNGTTLAKNASYLNKNIIEILDNGYCIITPEDQNPKKTVHHKLDLVSPEGKTVIKNGLNMRVLTDIGMIICQNETTLKEYERLYNYYDLKGNLLLTDVSEHKMSSPNLLGIFGKEYDKLNGLYNYKTRKMVWENSFTEKEKVRLVHHFDFGFSQIEVDTTFFFINDQGTNVMSIGGYNRSYNLYNRAKTIKISPPYNPEDPFKYKYLTALRTSEKKPFVIYDENYKKAENIQEFLGNSDQNIYAFKEFDKWKLADFDGLVLSDKYDSITYTKTDHNFRLYKNGQSQIYLRKAKKLIPVFDYDDAIGYEHHNYYLGIKYLEKLKRGDDYRSYKYLKCQVDLIDTKGNIIYSFNNDPDISISYALTATNQIVEYPEDNKYFHFRIHNTKTKEIKTMKERILSFENYKDMPVLVNLASDNIVDDHKRGLWNINKYEWIRTLTKENISYQSQEIDFYNEKERLNTLSLIEVKDNPDYKPDIFLREKSRRINTIIGYINIDGTFYTE